MKSEEMVTLDGSQGEGGGQILRSSLTLSMATGRPFRIHRIRANRSKPGLMRQHLTAVQAAGKICSAKVEGDAIGSTELTFRPGALRTGDYHFSVGTAGSTTLVFQTVMPALLTTGTPFAMTLEGGTHNSASPCLDFLERVYLPCLEKMGVQSRISVERRGFYPAGGGKWHVEIRPPQSLAPFELLEKGAFGSLRAKIIWAKIPGMVPERESAYLKKKLGLEDGRMEIEEARDSIGPGNAILAEIRYGNVTEIATGFGEYGVSSEAVADGVVREIREYQKSGAPVGPHLADQLLIPMVLGQGGTFRTLPLTLHGRTNIETIGKFLSRPIEARTLENRIVEIHIPP
jgi:RNA 3'-terminal phosphate cyclase (ATP)